MLAVLIQWTWASLALGAAVQPDQLLWPPQLWGVLWLPESFAAQLWRVASSAVRPGQSLACLHPASLPQLRLALIQQAWQQVARLCRQLPSCLDLQAVEPQLRQQAALQALQKLLAVQVLELEQQVVLHGVLQLRRLPVVLLPAMSLELPVFLHPSSQMADVLKFATAQSVLLLLTCQTPQVHQLF